MTVGAALWAEFEHESTSTRKVLARVPDAKFTWKPHPKSFSFGELAAHLATIPKWAAMTMQTEQLDVCPGGVPIPSPTPRSQAEVLQLLDQHVAEARRALQNASDDQFMKNWTLLANAKPIFTMPKRAVLRGMVLNHTIHHRGQLTVYLRLNNLAVPSIYGPSADEGQM